MVYLLLFVSLAILSSYFHIAVVGFLPFISSSLFNSLFVLLVVLTLKLYASFRLKKKLFETIGIGDLLLFIILAMGFPTVSFLILFSFSLLFSFALFQVVRQKWSDQTVPLAGFQALFLAVVLTSSKLFPSIKLYLLSSW